MSMSNNGDRTNFTFTNESWFGESVNPEENPFQSFIDKYTPKDYFYVAEKKEAGPQFPQKQLTTDFDFDKLVNTFYPGNNEFGPETARIRVIDAMLKGLYELERHYMKGIYFIPETKDSIDRVLKLTREYIKELKYKRNWLLNQSL